MKWERSVAMGIDGRCAHGKRETGILEVKVDLQKGASCVRGDPDFRRDGGAEPWAGASMPLGTQNASLTGVPWAARVHLMPACPATGLSGL